MMGHHLGKGEVDSSILSGSTSQMPMKSQQFRRLRGNPVTPDRAERDMNARGCVAQFWHRLFARCSVPPMTHNAPSVSRTWPR